MVGIYYIIITTIVSSRQTERCVTKISIIIIKPGKLLRFYFRYINNFENVYRENEKQISSTLRWSTVAEIGVPLE